MLLEARKYLFDIKQAIDLIDGFCAGKSIVDYQHEPMLRSAVERQFEIKRSVEPHPFRRRAGPRREKSAGTKPMAFMRLMSRTVAGSPKAFFGYGDSVAFSCKSRMAGEQTWLEMRD